MSLKQIALIVFVAAILPSFAAIGYVYSLPPPERWLFTMKTNAESYADALLSNDSAKQARYKNEFKSYAVDANQKTKTVAFSSTDDHEKFTLIYAPNENSNWIGYEQTGAKRIQEKWYILVQ